MGHCRRPAQKRPKMIRQLQQEIVEWSEGKQIVPRGLVFLFLDRKSCRLFFNPAYLSVFGGINLGIHELGHVVLGFFQNEFLGITGGTIFQLGAPLLSFFLFWRQSDYFAFAFSFVWLSTNLYYISVYAADARAMALPMVSVGGGEVYHDGNYMLSDLGLLCHDKVIAKFVRFFAGISMGIGLLYGAWVIWLMATAARRKRASQ